MQGKIHRRDIGYSELLRSYDRIKFEEKYKEWVESKEVKEESN
jgi:hypothetical protein